MSTLKVDTITTISGTGNINLSRPIAGDGSNLTGISPTKATIEALGIELPAANLTGTVADARFPATLPASSGVNLTALNASNISSGTLPSGRYTDTVYTHPTTAGNKHIPSGGATNQVLTYSSSGTASWVTPASSGADTNLGNLSTTGGQKVCRAWINFNGTGSIAIRDDFNVSSITDVGSGRTTVTFASAMSSGTYSACSTAARTATSSMDPNRNSCCNKITTSSFVVTSGRASHGDHYDVEVNTAQVFGD